MKYQNISERFLEDLRDSQGGVIEIERRALLKLGIIKYTPEPFFTFHDWFRAVNPIEDSLSTKGEGGYVNFPNLNLGYIIPATINEREVKNLNYIYSVMKGNWLWGIHSLFCKESSGKTFWFGDFYKIEKNDRIVRLTNNDFTRKKIFYEYKDYIEQKNGRTGIIDFVFQIYLPVIIFIETMMMYSDLKETIKTIDLFNEAVKDRRKGLNYTDSIKAYFNKIRTLKIKDILKQSIRTLKMRRARNWAFVLKVITTSSEPNEDFYVDNVLIRPAIKMLLSELYEARCVASLMLWKEILGNKKCIAGYDDWELIKFFLPVVFKWDLDLLGYVSYDEVYLTFLDFVKRGEGGNELETEKGKEYITEFYARHLRDMVVNTMLSYLPDYDDLESKKHITTTPYKTKEFYRIMAYTNFLRGYLISMGIIREDIKLPEDLPDNRVKEFNFYIESVRRVVVNPPVSLFDLILNRMRELGVLQVVPIAGDITKSKQIKELVKKSSCDNVIRFIQNKILVLFLYPNYPLKEFEDFKYMNMLISGIKWIVSSCVGSVNDSGTILENYYNDRVMKLVKKMKKPSADKEFKRLGQIIRLFKKWNKFEGD